MIFAIPTTKVPKEVPKEISECSGLVGCGAKWHNRPHNAPEASTVIKPKLKDQRLHVKFDCQPTMYAALERIAGKEMRSLSSLVRRIIADYLLDHGLVTQEELGSGRRPYRGSPLRNRQTVRTTDG
jgi:hypothetical protein